MKGFINRFGWLVILSSCLGTSGWSLYFVARHLGAPIFISAVVSATLDGVALLSADYALKYARSGDSGTGPRFTVYVFAGLSAYLNFQHALIAGEPKFAGILWAIPAIGAVVVFEWHTRWEKRASLTRANRTVPPLPTLGFWSWFLFPFKTLADMKRLIHHRRERIMTRYGLPPITRSEGQPAVSFSEPPESLPVGSESSTLEIESSGEVSYIRPSEIREWAKLKGYVIAERGSIPGNIMAEYYRENSRKEEGA
jgi:Protein of unknown function (DUF2637)